MTKNIAQHSPRLFPPLAVVGDPSIFRPAGTETFRVSIPVSWMGYHELCLALRCRSAAIRALWEGVEGTYAHENLCVAAELDELVETLRELFGSAVRNAEEVTR